MYFKKIFAAGTVFLMLVPSSAEPLRRTERLATRFYTQVVQKGVQLDVSPNPGGGIFTVTYKSEKRGQLMLAVNDATGKYVYLKSIRDFSGEIKEIVDLTGNPKGLYIFEAEQDGSREMKKVILQ